MSWIGRLSQKKRETDSLKTAATLFISYSLPTGRRACYRRGQSGKQTEGRPWVSAAAAVLRTAQHTLRRVRRNRRAQQHCAKLSSKESFSFFLHKGFFLLAFSEAHRRDRHPGQSLVWWAEIWTC